MNIVGARIGLRPAQESERRKIYNWLAHSDVTPSMAGPPHYTEHPIPTWEEFCSDYHLSYFNESGNGKGRNYIIVAGADEVGTIGYDLLDKQETRVGLDIWMRAEEYCGLGYGSDALSVLTAYVNDNYGITSFMISPSARNKRAIAAYKKAGFEYVKILDKEEQIKEFGMSEYDDNVLMIKNL